MDKIGTLVLGDAYAAYFGMISNNDLHQHAAIQIVISHDEPAAVYDEQGKAYCGQVLLIRPLVLHAMQGTYPLVTFYIEPQSRLGMELIDQSMTEDISILAPASNNLFAKRERDAMLQLLDRQAGIAAEDIDDRLAQAIAILSRAREPISLGEVAVRCGISETTLRSLARDQLGMPLSTWLIWRKLGRSANALSQGAELSEAAIDGGFADQAHFSRVMRRMFGITPALASRSLHWEKRK